MGFSTDARNWIVVGIFPANYSNRVAAVRERSRSKRGTIRTQNGAGERKKRDIARVDIDPTRIEENGRGGVYGDHIDANKI